MDWVHVAEEGGQLVGCGEHGNEPCVFIKHGKFLGG